MRNGVCAKCGASEVMVARLANTTLPVGMSKFSGVQSDLYACMECGYLELYATADGLRKMQNHGTRVTPSR